jgi:DNA-binding transcriptional MocR family regulator
VRADRVAADLAQQGVLVMTAESFAATHHVPQALRLALGALSLEALGKALHSIKAALASA